MTMTPTILPGGISTTHLVLRGASESQAQAVQAYYLENRAHLQPWEPQRSDDFYELNVIVERLRSVAEQDARGASLHLLVYERGRDDVIGVCNFSNVVRGAFQACHLGFAIDGHMQGQGLMHEALTAAMAHVFSTMRLHRIMANYRPENVRSASLLARLGFEREGLARAYLKINGVWADHILTSRINPQQI